MTEPHLSISWPVAVVEDHVLQRNRTAELLAADPAIEVVFTGETLPELLTWIESAPATSQPRLVLLDLMVERGPNADPAAVQQLVDDGIKVLLFTAMASPPLVRRMMQVGISGIVGKRDSEADVLTAVHTVLAGEEWITSELAAAIAQDPNRPKLSAQEERALVLYASGLTVDAVATAIGVRRDTAKKYLQRVKDKYAAAGRPLHSKVDMTRAVLADGLSDLSEVGTPVPAR